MSLTLSTFGSKQSNCKYPLLCFSLSLLLASIFQLPTFASAQAPDVLFKVVMKKNGSAFRTESPAVLWTDTSSSGSVTYFFEGDAVSAGNTLTTTISNSIYGWAGSMAPNQAELVTVYVKGQPTATVAVETDLSLSTMSTGTPLAESSASYPLNAGTVLATKPNGVTGTYTNNGSHADTLSKALSCTPTAAHDGCTTFAAYPGVTYCIPKGAGSMTVTVGTKNTGSWSSWVDISANLVMTVVVGIGSSTPVAVINGPFQGGVPVSIAAVNTSTTIYNDSYDPDDATGTPRVGICSASWQVLSPSNTVVATGTNIFSVIFTPTTTGTYTVNLDVVDNEGNLVSGTQQILVQ